MKRRFTCADLFCGAGGTSTGAVQALQSFGYGLEEIDLTAVNHWDIAVETHALNHPWARHLCMSLDQVNPAKVVPGNRLNLLFASPECTHHSRARGGKPMNDQSRASAWLLFKWLTDLYVETVVIENVQEFLEWGPLGADGRPLASKRGVLFQQFCSNLRALGYAVEHRILCAADYGAATTRERLFVIARRGRRRITWPERTHAPAGRERTLFENLQPWRPAREIIDWSLKGKSIFNRKRPLQPATLERIYAGMKRFKWPEPFLVVLRRHMDARSLDEPLPTLTAGGTHVGLVEPFVLGQQSCSAPRSVAGPTPTISTAGAISVIEPFIVEYRGSHAGRADGSRRVKSISDPLPTQTTENRFGIAEPFVFSMEHGRSGFILPVNHGRDSRTYPLDGPMPTITTVDAWGMAEPFLVPYYETGVASSLDEPLETITTRDRFGLVTPDGYQIDVLFRMLQPHELAAAMSFPADYRFAGTREQKVKQIGNAVDVRQARAIALEVAA